MATPALRPSPAGPTGQRAEAERRVIRRLGTDDRSSARVRIVDAALACIGRNGTAKTTVDDIAREAGLSRATLYRTFPGGKDAVFEAAVETEVARIFSALAVVMGEADDLEGVLVTGLAEAARRLSDHAALNYLLEREPEVILPHLAFSEMDGVLHTASAFAAPFFGRWLDSDQATRAAEWATRIVISYVSCPTPGFDLRDPHDALHLVRRFVLPGVMALRSDAAQPTAGALRRHPSATDHPTVTSQPIATTTRGKS